MAKEKSRKGRRERTVILLLLACVALGAPPAHAKEPELGERTLQLGSWGADVFKLQLALNQAGYDLVSDGHFGRETERTVMAFQLAHNLTPDGIVGPKTLAALRYAGTTATYVVVPGDSLWAIARRFDTTMDELVRMNDLPDGPLRVGQRLNVPVRPEYTVQPGDTLSAIAQRFDTTVSALMQANGIENPDLIRAGTTLRLPHRSGPITYRF